MFINNENPQDEDPPNEEAHMIEPPAEEEPPLMGLVGDITEEAAQQMSMALLGYNGGKILSSTGQALYGQERSHDDPPLFLECRGYTP